MKSSELRIGNLVKINNDLLPETHGKTYSVYKLQKTFDFDFPSSAGIVSLTDKVNMYTQFDQFIEPIPLTEEWLERFGLEHVGYDLLFWEKDSPTGVFSISGYDEIGFGVRYNKEIEPPLKYVHQLQNLYFALTGEELTLKEEA